MMKKRIIAFILLCVVGLSSCGSNAVKYSPGDTWKIKLTDEFSLECHFEEINTERLVFTLNKVNREDTYNFAIKGSIPCDYLFVNDEKVCMKTAGAVPISYYDVTQFRETNRITIPFREGTEEYQKIDVKAYHSFLKEGDRSFIGVAILLYKY